MCGIICKTNINVKMGNNRSSKPQPGREHGFYRRISAAFIVCAALSLLLSSHPALARPSNNASKLILSAKNEKNVINRIGLYIRIGNIEDQSVLNEVKLLLKNEKEPDAILAALYAYLRPKYKESKTISNIFQNSKEALIIDPIKLFALIDDDKKSCSDFISDAAIVDREMLPDEALLQVIKDNNNYEIIRAMGLVVAGNRENKALSDQLHIGMKSITLSDQLSIVQIMSALALNVKNPISLIDYFKTAKIGIRTLQNAKNNAFIIVLHEEKREKECDDYLETDLLARQNLYLLIEYTFSQKLVYLPIDNSYLEVYITDRDDINYCKPIVAEINNYPKTHIYKYLTYLTAEQRIRVLLQMLVIYNQPEDSILIVEKLKKELGDTFFDQIINYARNIKSELTKYYIITALRSYHSHLEEIGLTTIKEDTEFEFAVDSLKTSNIIVFTTYSSYAGASLTHSEPIEFKNAYLVKGTCKTSFDDQSIFNYEKCDTDLIHLKYTYDLPYASDEEWTLIMDIEGRFDKPGDFTVGDNSRIHIYYHHQNAPSIVFKKADGNIRLEPDGKKYKFSGDMDISGRRIIYGSSDTNNVKNGNLSGNAVLTEMNFDQFISLIDE